MAILGGSDWQGWRRLASQSTDAKHQRDTRWRQVRELGHEPRDLDVLRHPLGNARFAVAGIPRSAVRELGHLVNHRFDRRDTPRPCVEEEPHPRAATNDAQPLLGVLRAVEISACVNPDDANGMSDQKGPRPPDKSWGLRQSQVGVIEGRSRGPIALDADGVAM